MACGSGATFHAGCSELTQVVDSVYIIAYQEDVSRLALSLEKEGFRKVKVLRQAYSSTELGYTRIARCLFGHVGAWSECIGNDGFSIVLEADFVPVVGFGRLPLPFSLDRKGEAWGFLYSSAQRVYEIVDGSFIRGHSSAPVAYVLDRCAAQVLTNFAEDEFRRCDPRRYLNAWDTYIRIFAQRYGILTYIPFRSYGEHGGIPNPEHKASGVNPVHRADVLWGKLHFLPTYATGSIIRYFAARLLARLKAVLRLLTGRFVEYQLLTNSSIPLPERWALVLFGVKRLSPF